MALDAKAPVKIGPLGRDGKRRCPTEVADQDVAAKVTVTPGGIVLPSLDERFVEGVTAKGTSDYLADRLVDRWEAVANYS